MDEPLDEFLTVCRNAARAGGDVLLDWAGRFAVREKGRADLVTEADLGSQEAIRAVVGHAFPDHGFLGEEGDASTEGRDGYRWVVDPLDGTTNYVHGFPQFAVSIALERHGRLLVGTVYDPSSNECFSAAVGRGAWLNDRPLKVSQVQRLEHALVAASLPPAADRNSAAVAEFLTVMERAQAIRRMGSSALNLCYLAAGRVDAYWARDTKIWDIAAGFLFVTEAGGIVTEYDGGPVELARPKFVAAATTSLHGELLGLLRAQHA